MGFFVGLYLASSQCFKSALVTTIIKKRCLDHNDLYNYQPVTNLCITAKILKKTCLILSLVDRMLVSGYRGCRL